VRCSVLQCVAVCCSVHVLVRVELWRTFTNTSWHAHAGMSCGVLQGVVVCCVCCSVLRCVAVCCSILQCIAVCCCSVLQCVAVCCRDSIRMKWLQQTDECAMNCGTHVTKSRHAHKRVTAHTSMRCSALQCASIYSILQCAAVCCSVLQCVAVCCSVLQCVAVCCSVLQCVAVC